MQIEKIQKFVYRPRERDISLKIDEIVKKLNILIEDHNYVDKNEI